MARKGRLVHVQKDAEKGVISLPAPTKKKWNNFWNKLWPWETILAFLLKISRPCRGISMACALSTSKAMGLSYQEIPFPQLKEIPTWSPYQSLSCMGNRVVVYSKFCRDWCPWQASWSLRCSSLQSLFWDADFALDTITVNIEPSEAERPLTYWSAPSGPLELAELHFRQGRMTDKR